MMQVNLADLFTDRIRSGLNDKYAYTTRACQTYEEKLIVDMEVVRRVNKMIKETHDFLPSSQQTSRRNDYERL